LCDKGCLVLKSAEGDHGWAVVEQQPLSKLPKLLIEDRKGYVVVRIRSEIVKAPDNVMERYLF
jgi:hypothetical protein